MTPDEDPRFLVGSAKSDHLSICAFRRNHPECTDFWDGNWLRCRIKVSAGGLRGEIEADLRAEDFTGLHEGLSKACHELSGQFTFKSMEPWLAFEITGDGRGHFEMLGDVKEGPAWSNGLRFALRFDQTEIPPMLEGLQRMSTSFPVIGRP